MNPLKLALSAVFALGVIASSAAALADDNYGATGQFYVSVPLSPSRHVLPEPTYGLRFGSTELDIFDISTPESSIGAVTFEFDKVGSAAINLTGIDYDFETGLHLGGFGTPAPAVSGDVFVPDFGENQDPFFD